MNVGETIIIDKRETGNYMSGEGWPEYLVLEKLKDRKYKLDIRRDEVIDEAHNYCAVNGLIDDDGNINPPTQVDGKDVYVEDGYIYSNDIVQVDYDDAEVTFKISEPDVVLDWFKKGKWNYDQVIKPSAEMTSEEESDLEESQFKVFIRRSLLDRAMHSDGLTKDQLRQLDKSTMLRALEIAEGEAKLSKALKESPRLQKFLENRKNSTSSTSKKPSNMKSKLLRDRLVEVALEWQEKYGVAPSITSIVSEYDAARLVGMPDDEYVEQGRTRTAVSRGFDFIYDGKRYQVKANRPSGKPGSRVTLVGKARNYEWDYLIWILYYKSYEIEEAWLWDVDQYREQFDHKKRLSPADMRLGKYLAD